MLHTILGANGTIAQALLPVLQAHHENIRLVSRKPQPVEGTETRAANVLDYEQLYKALDGSDIVYLTIGIPYNAKLWAIQWPQIMQNVIRVSKAIHAKLVFFDDAYMYGKVDGPITEETPYKPSSKKGVVRAYIARLLEAEMKAGNLEAIIARAVDFYGPGVTDKSAAGTLVFANMLKGKRPQWFINPDVPRAYNYTPDAAKALYMLAITAHAYGQIWHLPSVRPALTGRQFIGLAAKYMGGTSKIMVIPKWMIRLIGVFNPFMRDMVEMGYQDEFPFLFDSSKFEKAFQFTPTSYEEGVKATANWYLQQANK
ncbi:nucleoside-diphosphate-sugar epimerase [Chitinophaga skermanii]|uniref:Nucleoside-diphosphate-sugar epimerase n=1 Tax=Chitinophaga skermanii TaxID=331697 RepID=A0A327R2R7_9BACT|nr:NAD-dependent epimerase/dehydratase family protein [Chitinophaga skermanii]RAJ11116.1 nucleoside-diphosphate-sugar epimerase [Chitinophaga skermanii]